MSERHGSIECARAKGSTGAATTGLASGFVCAAALVLASLIACQAPEPARPDPREQASTAPIQLGPRPFYLIDRVPAGTLRDRLEACRSGPFRSTRFSIGHRGAPLQFPEHTRESYLAAARMGAGLIECDVSFTRDHELICRHSACDLAATTDILETPLAARCREPFRPAILDPDSGALRQPASAVCCTEDLSLDELRQLEARMQGVDPSATSLEGFLAATPSWRTDLYTNGAKLMSHDDSLRLLRELGVSMTPELKAAAPGTSGATAPARRARARRLLEAYREAGVPAADVRLQSFDAADVRVWLELAPDYGARAIWLVERTPTPLPSPAELAALYDEGFRTIGASIGMLLRVDEAGRLRSSDYASRARAAGLGLVGWTLERSGRIRAGRVEGRERDFYLDPVLAGLEDDGDVYRVLHALATEVGVEGVFSDWPATTTYYANCFGLD